MLTYRNARQRLSTLTLQDIGTHISTMNRDASHRIQESKTTETESHEATKPEAAEPT